LKKDLLTSLIDSLPYAAFLFDHIQKKVIYTNSYSYNLFELDLAATDLTHLINRLPESEQSFLNEKFSNLVEGTPIVSLDIKLPSEDNVSEKWIRLDAVRLEINAALIFSTARDVSDELVKVNLFHKFANKKNSILNILSHDLRGPLGIAQMATSVLTKEVQRPELKTLSITASTILRRSIDLIADFTAQEFLQTAEIALVKKGIDIVGKVRELVEEYMDTSTLINRKIEFNSNQQIIFLEVDEPKIVQVFNNLMSNALKFTRADGTISVEIEDKGRSVMFSVADNGIGIPETLLPVLFDKFTKASRVGLNGEPTTGLGMYVIKTLIEWHGGKIWAYSTENVGTTVSFELQK
jgi:two-component system sensor histidine kinase VicK